MDEPEIPAAATVRRGHLRTRDWARVSHGLYRRPLPGTSQPDPPGPGVVDRARLRADLEAWALVLPPSACFTSLTAAVVYGWALPPLPHDLPVLVAMAESEARPKRPGIRVSRHPEAPRRTRGPLPLAHPADALLHAARDLGLLDLVVLADSALHRGDCTRAELVEAGSRGRRGGPALRRALPWVDARAESPWETLLRVLHVACEVPVVPQHEVYDAGGCFVARGDLWLPGTRVLHEYDGEVHRRTRRQHRRDLERERALGNAGWTRRGYTSLDVLARAAGVLREADAALGREHDRRRLDAWHALLRESLFSPVGRDRARRRWRLPG